MIEKEYGDKLAEITKPKARLIVTFFKFSLHRFCF